MTAPGGVPRRPLPASRRGHGATVTQGLPGPAPPFECWRSFRQSLVVHSTTPNNACARMMSGSTKTMQPKGDVKVRGLLK